MSKIDEIRAEMVKAMKEKDKERKDSLSMLLSALKNKAIDKREDLTEDEENEVIKKRFVRPEKLWSRHLQTERISKSSVKNVLPYIRHLFLLIFQRMQSGKLFRVY